MIKRYKPTSPGMRWRTTLVFRKEGEGMPSADLIQPIKKTGGRNNVGRICTRHIGGGHKRMYRVIDFKRDKDTIPARVIAIDYDPNRTVRIALLAYADGEKRYILCPEGLKLNQAVASGTGIDIVVGNCLALKDIPAGTTIHNIELKAGKGGQIARTAGSAAVLVGKENDWAQVKMPSGEIRLISLDCRATIGQLGNTEHSNVSIGKAGRSRWMGIYPSVRGVAQNPVDHPMGGGEGKTSGGRHPTSPWGWKTKGLKTRNNKRTDKWIVKHRTK